MKSIIKFILGTILEALAGAILGGIIFLSMIYVNSL